MIMEDIRRKVRAKGSPMNSPAIKTVCGVDNTKSSVDMALLLEDSPVMNIPIHKKSR